MLPPPPRSTLFPYTTLFRSSGRGLAFSNQIGDTLTNVFTTAQNLRASASFPTATLRLDAAFVNALRSEEHTSELQSHSDLVCRLLLEKKKKVSTTPAVKPAL